MCHYRVLVGCRRHVEIARYFLQDEEFFNSLNEMQNSAKMDKAITKTLKKLIARIQGWASFENALADSNGDFSACAIFLKDMSADEHSLGCWLECMLIHENLTSKLSLTPIPSEALPPPLLLQERHSSVTRIPSLLLSCELFLESQLFLPHFRGPTVLGAVYVGKEPLVYWFYGRASRVTDKSVSIPHSTLFVIILIFTSWIDCQPLPTTAPTHKTTRLEQNRRRTDEIRELRRTVARRTN